MSIREAKSRFTEAAAAAARGERVVVTKHGRPFVELVPVRALGGMDFEAGLAISRELGLAEAGIEIPPHFDDAAFSREVLGLDEPA